MNIQKLVSEATDLEAKITAADDQERYDLHQKLHRCLSQIKLYGGQVPNHLRKLDLDMIDEEVEDSFDNMPI